MAQRVRGGGSCHRERPHARRRPSARPAGRAGWDGAAVSGSPQRHHGQEALAGEPDEAVATLHGPFAPEPVDARAAAPPLFTVGHGTAERDEIARLLEGAGIAVVVDVRTAPGSRRHPHVARQQLAAWLPARGIAYRWEPDLGGFRTPPPASPDVVWRNTSFRGYAAHTRTPGFVTAMDRLLREAATTATTVMCSEAVWWRCHRRLIADFAVVARGMQVRHLMHDGRVQAHVPTPGVRLRADGLLVYDDVAAARTPSP